MNLENVELDDWDGTEDDSAQPPTASGSNSGDAAAGPSNASENSSPTKNPQPHQIIVSNRQRGNPLLTHIRQSKWTYADIEPDYIVGTSACVMFLSLRYHALNPNYIYDRLAKVGKKFALTILLAVVDHLEHEAYLKELGRACITGSCTLMLAWSYEDAARIIDTYKSLEGKSTDEISGPGGAAGPSGSSGGGGGGSSYESAVEALGTIKGISKTDCTSLVSLFGSLERIISADKEQLAICPGMGFTKANKVHSLFRRPFIKKK